MSRNSEALRQYNSGRAFGMTGIIFATIGSGLIGRDLETRIGGDEGNGNGTF